MTGATLTIHFWLAEDLSNKYSDFQRVEKPQVRAVGTGRPSKVPAVLVAEPLEDP